MAVLLQKALLQDPSLGQKSWTRGTKSLITPPLTTVDHGSAFSLTTIALCHELKTKTKHKLHPHKDNMK